MTTHSDKRFAEDLAALTQNLLKMAHLVEGMIASAMQGLEKRDAVLARAVLKEDEEIDLLEMQIDEKCVEALALHQPAASDLRFVTMAIRFASDLERMGDLAVNVAERSLEMNAPVPRELLERLPQIAQHVKKMLEQTLHAFIQKDEALARAVCAADDDVDALNRKFFADALVLMKQDTNILESAMRLISVSRYLERIADHCTNVAEEVIFLISGKDIRHQDNGGK